MRRLLGIDRQVVAALVREARLYRVVDIPINPRSSYNAAHVKKTLKAIADAGVKVLVEKNDGRHPSKAPYLAIAFVYPREPGDFEITGEGKDPASALEDLVIGWQAGVRPRKKGR